MGSPLFLLRDEPQLFVAFVIAVIVGITLHEFRPPPQGPLTPNPIAPLDPLGSIALILAGFGWGRPVPVNPTALRSRRFGGILVGLAGPAANFVVALISVIALRIAYPTTGLTFDVPFS